MNLSRFLVCMTAAAALAACNQGQQDAASNEPVNLTPVAPPAGGEWTAVVSETPEGGMLMGNPDARVKLVEYASMTCPHCREFDETGVEPLINTYVKSGQVSYELRNYVRDPFDLAATLIARCNGPDGFFPLTRALFKDQNSWIGKVQTVPGAQLDNLSNLPSGQIGPTAARYAGLLEWAVARGIPEAKSAQCLSNETRINKLVEATGAATEQFPNFPGTPSFLINGELVENTATWKDLEPKLREALR